MALNSDIFTTAKELNEELGTIRETLDQNEDRSIVNKLSHTIGRILKNHKSITQYAKKSTIETLVNQLEHCKTWLPNKNTSNIDIAETLRTSQRNIEITLNRAIDDILSSLENDKSIFAEIKAIHENSYEKVKTAEQEFREQITKLNNSHKALLKTNEDEFKSTFDKIDKQRKQAEEIVSLIGGAGISSSFQKVANKEEERADTMRRITLVIFSVSIALALLSFYLFQTSDWHQSIFRIILSFIVASPAYYTAKESARHRTNADRARQVELELASLPAYISDFNEADQKKIKEDLIKSYFGKNINDHTVEGFVSQRDIFDSLNSIIRSKISDQEKGSSPKLGKAIISKKPFQQQRI